MPRKKRVTKSKKTGEEVSVDEQFGDREPVPYRMYDDRIVMFYEDAKHQYFLDGPDGRVYIPSVTTACGVIDKSNFLMPWAVRMAIQKLEALFGFNNEEGKLRDPKSLPNPSLDIPQSPEVMYKFLELARREYRQYTKDATDIGHMAHEWLEGYAKIRVKGGSHNDALGWRNLPKNPKAINCISAALDWYKEHNVQFIGLEVKVYSEMDHYAGTLDVLAYVDDKLSILDYKSSRALYDEYRFQTAAYQAAYMEEHPGTVIEQRILLKLGKEDGEFETKIFTEEDEYHNDLDTFKAALIIKNRLDELREQAKVERAASGRSRTKKAIPTEKSKSKKKEYTPIPTEGE